MPYNHDAATARATVGAIPQLTAAATTATAGLRHTVSPDRDCSRTARTTAAIHPGRTGKITTKANATLSRALVHRKAVLTLASGATATAGITRICIDVC